MPVLSLVVFHLSSVWVPCVIMCVGACACVLIVCYVVGLAGFGVYSFLTCLTFLGRLRD